MRAATVLTCCLAACAGVVTAFEVNDDANSVTTTLLNNGASNVISQDSAARSLVTSAALVSPSTANHNGNLAAAEGANGAEDEEDESDHPASAVFALLRNAWNVKLLGRHHHENNEAWRKKRQAGLGGGGLGLGGGGAAQTTQESLQSISGYTPPRTTVVPPPTNIASGTILKLSDVPGYDKVSSSESIDIPIIRIGVIACMTVAGGALVLL